MDDDGKVVTDFTTGDLLLLIGKLTSITASLNIAIERQARGDVAGAIKANGVASEIIDKIFEELRDRLTRAMEAANGRR